MAWYFPNAQPTPERVILAYGDSQGEVMDYVFHGSDEYVKYRDDGRVGWRSGWSTRGLGKAEHIARFLEPLSSLDEATRHAFVILSYGSVDIEWNLSYKRDVLKQNVDTDAFIGEMVGELAACVDRIYAKGEELRARGGPEVHVVLCVPFVPLPLSDGYLEDFERRNGGNVEDSYKVIDHAERMRLWSQFCDLSHGRICAAHPQTQVVDVRDDFATKGFDAYTLDDHEDHHPDLAKTQHAVAARVERLRFAAADGSTLRLTPKPWPHKAMYPHLRRRFGKTAKASHQPSPLSSLAASPYASPEASPTTSPQVSRAPSPPPLELLPPPAAAAAACSTSSRADTADGSTTALSLGERKLSSDSIMVAPWTLNSSPSAAQKAAPMVFSVSLA